MKRILKTAALAVVAVGILGSTGCCLGQHGGIQGLYNNKVDPCWPERYSYQARQETMAPFAAQATNGHVLDQTIFNYHFEAGTDKLTAGGLEKLDYLARRRPNPDPKLYLATARDLAYDPAAPEKMGAARVDLDAKRTAAIQKYLTASNAGRTVGFDVAVIDPADQTMNSTGPATAVRGLPSRYQSGLAGGAAGLSGAGGGSAPASSAGGGGTGTGGR